MKRVLTTAMLPLLVCPLVLAGGGPSAAADGDSGCVEPVAKRTYNRFHLGYRLDVDLTDCEWWDGSPVRLEASLDRFDVAEGHGAASFVLCSALPADPDSDEAADGAPVVERTAKPSGVCGVEVTLDHPPTEAARYRGEISFPWEGAVRTVGFTALCGPAGTCVDLPVEPTEFLGPAADLYDAIAGEGDAG